MNVDQLPKLFNATNEAIKRAAGDGASSTLFCSEARLVHGFDGAVYADFWEIEVRKANHNSLGLQAFIAERLAAAGFHGCVVRTEW